MVGDSGGFSAVRSSRSGRSAACTATPEISRRKSAGSAATARRTRASKSGWVICGAGGNDLGSRGRRRRQVPRGRRLVARPLLDEPQVIKRVGVIGRLGQHLGEGGPRLVEPAELEQRHAAFVDGRPEVRLRDQGGVDPPERLGCPPEIDQRLPLQKGQPRDLLDVAPGDVAAPAPGVLQPQRRAIARRRELIDLQVGGGLQRLRIVGRQRQRQLERIARLVQPVQPHERDGPVVVRLDRPRRRAGRLLGAGQRAGVVALVEEQRRLVEQIGDRRVDPGRLLGEAAPERPGRLLGGIAVLPLPGRLLALGVLRVLRGRRRQRRWRTDGPCGGVARRRQPPPSATVRPATPTRTIPRVAPSEFATCISWIIIPDWTPSARPGWGPFVSGFGVSGRRPRWRRRPHPRPAEPPARRPFPSRS